MDGDPVLAGFFFCSQISALQCFDAAYNLAHMNTTFEAQWKWRRRKFRRDEVFIARREKRLRGIREGLDGLAKKYEQSKSPKDGIYVLGEIVRVLAALRPGMVLNLFEKSKKVPLSKRSAHILPRLEQQAELMRESRYPSHGRHDRAWGQLVLEVDTVYPGTKLKFLNAAKRLELESSKPAEEHDTI